MVSAKMSKADKQVSSGGGSSKSKASTQASNSKPPKEGSTKKNLKKVKKENKKVNSLIPPSTPQGGKTPQIEIEDKGATNVRNSEFKPNKSKPKKRDGDDKAENKQNELPISRVRRIIKADDSHLRVSDEAVFLISKATVKFLQQFTRESHACTVQDRRKSIDYQRLANVVSKQERYGFLSDHVPEKLKAKDALRKLQAAI